MTETVDVLIIGAGASGAAVAWSLAETRMRIVCLEQGDWMRNEDFPSTGRDWEQRGQDDFAISPNRRRLAADYPVNDDDSPIKVANFNGVGGGTILFAAHFPRLHPSDFRTRTLDGVGDDWPISYRDLEPFFETNDRMMGVSSLAGDPAYPPKKAHMPPIPLGRSGERIGRAMNSLGWHWWPADAAIATEEWEGRAPCINLGHCGAGCAQGAKGSADLTYWPAAIRARVELRTGARVKRIETGPDGMATGATYVTPDGQEVFQPAHMVVMACNGVGTPRILLNSASERYPDGLANSSGLVGRNLMLHPYGMIRGYFDAPVDAYRGPRISVWSMEFYETDPARDFKRGYCYQVSRGMAPAQTAETAMADGLLPWGAGHHDRFAELFGTSGALISICEDLPEEINRVTLDPHLTDVHGIPAPKLTYRLGENTERMLAHSLARGTEAMQAAGARDITTIAPLPYAGWHLMGTARMGTDPRRSVVNEWGRSHDVKNLFIVDGSVFVTSGGVNPTSTIQAVALYIADQIKARLAELFD